MTIKHTGGLAVEIKAWSYWELGKIIVEGKGIFEKNGDPIHFSLDVAPELIPGLISDLQEALAYQAEMEASLKKDSKGWHEEMEK